MSSFLNMFVTLLRYNSHTLQFTHFKGTIQWFLVYSQSGVTVTTVNFRTFCYPKKKPCTLEQSPLIFSQCPPTPAPGNHKSISLSVDLPILIVSYKWNSTIFGLLGLDSQMSFSIWSEKIILILRTLTAVKGSGW